MSSKNIIFILLLCFILVGLKNKKVYPLKLESGEIISTKLALTNQERMQGLSGIQSKNFKANDALLFVFERMATRIFWMPNTYFNLDIFFLNSNLKVIDIERNMPAYPSNVDVHKSKKTRPVIAKYVLEMRADSKLSKKIKKGMQLTFEGPKNLIQIKSNIHP